MPLLSACPRRSRSLTRDGVDGSGHRGARLSPASGYCQTSVMGLAEAALPAWPVPYMSSIVRSRL
jgi:hypothetical protein